MFHIWQFPHFLPGNPGVRDSSRALTFPFSPEDKKKETLCKLIIFFLLVSLSWCSEWAKNRARFVRALPVFLHIDWKCWWHQIKYLCIYKSSSQQSGIWLLFSRSVLSDSLRPHGPQHTRPPCPSPTPGAYSNSCPSSRWCHPTISSSVVPFSSHLQSFPASGSFQMSQFFASGGQCIGASASASALQVNIQDWFPLGWTGWISLQSKGLF